MRPFLKWAGGKYRLVGEIRRQLPVGQRLIEPFVGSGALFLNSDYPAYLLADINRDLIDLYGLLQRDGDCFIAEVGRLFEEGANTRATYDRRRAAFNRSIDPRVRAALFVYLNKHCYNGLCRYNSQGEFNVPFGRYQKVRFPRAEIESFAARGRLATFVCERYEHVMLGAQPGDVVYCDPPYAPLSATANFTAYNREGFGLDDQEQLAALAGTLRRRGVPVVISNHDTPQTRRFYHEATRLVTFPVRRHISRDGERRGTVQELLAIYLPEE